MAQASYLAEARRYTQAVEIDPADIDFMGHVNNAAYLVWVQAAVLNHWHQMASSEALSAYRWIAVKHEITYRKPAFLEDRLTATVDLEKVRRESAFYGIEIRREDQLIAEVKSRWCCIDAVTLGPVRIPENVIRCFGADLTPCPELST